MIILKLLKMSMIKNVQDCDDTEIKRNSIAGEHIVSMINSHINADPSSSESGNVDKKHKENSIALIKAELLAFNLSLQKICTVYTKIRRESGQDSTNQNFWRKMKNYGTNG